MFRSPSEIVQPPFGIVRPRCSEYAIALEHLTCHKKTWTTIGQLKYSGILGKGRFSLSSTLDSQICAQIWLEWWENYKEMLKEWCSGKRRSLKCSLRWENDIKITDRVFVDIYIFFTFTWILQSRIPLFSCILIFVRTGWASFKYFRAYKFSRTLNQFILKTVFLLLFNHTNFSRMFNFRA